MFKEDGDGAVCCNINTETSRKDLNFILSDYNFWQNSEWLDCYEYRMVQYIASRLETFVGEEEISKKTRMSVSKVGKTVNALCKMGIFNVQRGWKYINGHKTRVNIISINRNKFKEEYLKRSSQAQQVIISEKLMVETECSKLESQENSNMSSEKITISPNTNLLNTTTVQKSQTPKSSSSKKDKPKQSDKCRYSAPIKSTTKNAKRENITIPDPLLKIGITDKTLRQVPTDTMSDSDLQQSLDAYAFDIVHNDIIQKRKIKSPDSYFISGIKKGILYNPPQNYRSKQEIEIEERAQAERDAQERMEKIRERKEKESEWRIKNAYAAWVVNLSKEEKDYLVQQRRREKGAVYARNDYFDDITLRGYFEEKNFDEFYTYHMDARKPFPLGNG